MEKTADNQTSHRRLLLTDKNYFVWEVMMSGELANINCLDYVLGVDKEEEKKEERAKKSATLITRYLDEEHIGTIASELGKEERRNGKAIWDVLKRKYADDNQQAQVMAFTEFDRIDFSNIKDFTKEIKMAISRI